MHGFSAVVGFFKNLGEFLGRALHIIRDNVTDDQVKAALDLAKTAQDKFLDNADRRAFVIAELHKLFPMLPESVLRLLVELGVRLLKNELQKAEANAVK